MVPSIAPCLWCSQFLMLFFCSMRFLILISCLSTVKSFPQAIIKANPSNLASSYPNTVDADHSNPINLPLESSDLDGSTLIATIGDDTIVNNVDKSNQIQADTTNHIVSQLQTNRKPIKCYGKYIKQLCCWGPLSPDTLSHAAVCIVAWEADIKFKTVSNCGQCNFPPPFNSFSSFHFISSAIANLNLNR